MAAWVCGYSSGVAVVLSTESKGERTPSEGLLRHRQPHLVFRGLEQAGLGPRLGWEDLTPPDGASPSAPTDGRLFFN